MKPPASLCLVTPGHIASTPRAVKNADALAEAGYRVHVVAGRHYPPVDPLDDAIFAGARWSHTLVDYRGGPGVFARKLLRLACRRLVVRRPWATMRIAARAHQAETLRLAAAMAAVPADLYYGHCLAGLPAAAIAARRRRARYAADIEDYHDAETFEALAAPPEVAARRILQSALLPGATLVTAGSPLIAEKVREVYGTAALPLLNVFPRADAPAAPVDPGPVAGSRPARFYWFSQTIGPDRGLEDVIALMGRMATPAELHLRGFAAPGYEEHLRQLARTAGVRLPPVFLPPGLPSEMSRLAASSDVGFSTEIGRPFNRDISLPNKIFVYLLAGIPQFLSATSAQSALAAELGSAAILGRLDQPGENARKLDAFFSDPARVAAARRTAWDLAQRRFCWDQEKNVLLRALQSVLPAPR